MTTRELALHALVVDDDARWRALVTEILGEAGCIVTAMAAPPEAPGYYDLAVLDIALRSDAPDNRDGLSLIHRLPDTPIIYLSGLTEGDVAADLVQESNVLGFISKAAFQRADLIRLAVQAAARPPRRVLIVEDDPRWCAIYEELLSDAGYAPQLAASYGEARGWLQRVGFALAIVDLHLVSSTAPHDNRDGFWLLRAARQRQVPTIVISALGVPQDIDRAYEEFGAFAFIDKECFDRTDFRRMVTEAIRRRRAGEGAGVVSDAISSAEDGDRVLSGLTDREREVLGLLTRGCTNRQIGEALRITPNTVKKHVDHILQKLEVSNRAAAVAVALTHSQGVSGENDRHTTFNDTSRR